MCEHTLWGEPDGLACTRTDRHDSGHIYRSSAGSDVPDRHNEGSGE